MNHFSTRMMMALSVICSAFSINQAQNTHISGTVKDADTDLVLAGVNIVVKGLVIGTISDSDGYFELEIKQAPPLTVVFSFVGYGTKEMLVSEADVSDMNIKLEEQNFQNPPKTCSETLSKPS